AAELGVGDRVQFLGWVPRDRLHKLLRDEVDVFLFPSLRDQAPWAVAEASALGLPVVCLDVGGPPLLGGRAVTSALPAATGRALGEAVAAARARGTAPGGPSPRRGGHERLHPRGSRGPPGGSGGRPGWSPGASGSRPHP